MERTTTSRFAFSQHKPDAADGVNESLISVAVDFLSQSSNLHVDHVAYRRSAALFLPDLARQHFAGHEVALLPQQVLQELEFSAGQIERATASHNPPRGRVDLQV